MNIFQNREQNSKCHHLKERLKVSLSACPACVMKHFKMQHSVAWMMARADPHSSCPSQIHFYPLITVSQGCVCALTWFMHFSCVERGQKNGKQRRVREKERKGRGSRGRKRTLAGILMMEWMGLVREICTAQGHSFHSPRHIN